MRFPEVLPYSPMISQKDSDSLPRKSNCYLPRIVRQICNVYIDRSAQQESRSRLSRERYEVPYKMTNRSKTTASALSFLSEVLFWSFRRQFQPVSELIDRLDIRCPIQFFSQLLNMYIHGADIAQIIKAPCQIKQLLPR